MRFLSRRLRHCLSLALAMALLGPTIAGATPKPLDPGTAHVKILKRGVGNFISVQETSGVQLFGRILAIGDQTFTMQLHNDPQTTEIPYTDVAYLVTGFSTGQKVLFFAGIGGVAAGTIYGIVHFNNVANKPLNPPTPAAAQRK